MERNIDWLNLIAVVTIFWGTVLTLSLVLFRVWSRHKNKRKEKKEMKFEIKSPPPTWIRIINYDCRIGRKNVSRK